MRKFLLILLAMVTFEAAVAQDIKKEEACCSTEVKEEKVKKPRKPLINFEKVGKFFKYSTVYGVGQISQPITPANRNYYVTQENELIDVSPELKPNYSYGFGIRKVARFDYERKPGIFYDGNEQKQGFNTTIGAVSGWEYKFEYTWNRQFMNEFNNKDLYLRYLGKRFVLKGESYNNGFVDLEYNALDLRWRQPLGKKLNLSIGAIARSHRPYGYNPIDDYLNDLFIDEFGVERTRNWWELAYEYGYQDIPYSIDYDFDGNMDAVDYFWIDQGGNRVADTDQDFRANKFTSVVNRYNREQIALINDQGTVSAVIGLDLYHYQKNNWLHAWVSVLPYHQQLWGNEDFGYLLHNNNEQWLDYSAGLVAGWKITKNLGIFVESNYTKFWDREIYQAKAGLNFQFR